jgi:membrane-bound lytic murein transglycosylase B
MSCAPSLDRLVVVGEPERQRVAGVVGPLDDLDQLASEEVQDAHAATPVEAERPPFAEWLEEMRADALAHGISPATVNAAFRGLEPLPVVIQRDRAQAEFKETLDTYLQRRITPALVRDTRAALEKHRVLLGRVSDAYGVPPPIIVSIWALESSLGRFSGVRPVIAALATLAWEGRRATFFRNQLLDALTIVDQGHIELTELKGSWAGAMGQVQFMPSSFLKFAQDFDGDGRKDIWRSLPDVFASIAFYLQSHGWTPGRHWGREVQVPAAQAGAVRAAAVTRTQGCFAERQMSQPLAARALARARGAAARVAARCRRWTIDASLLFTGRRAFLLYGNYETLLRYNCAHAYALGVATLSDRVVAAPAPAAPKPKPPRSQPRRRSPPPRPRRRDV